MELDNAEMDLVTNATTTRKFFIEGDIHKKDIVEFERVRDENLEELLSQMTPDAVEELSQDYRIPTHNDINFRYFLQMMVHYNK